MHSTLLLCFIHGFKGGDDTFGNFPEHLRTLLSHALPNITVKAIVYPRFETRGDLAECVVRFREWLQNQVIDLEVAAATPSPTVEPSVHTLLLGHSMGGIVAAESLLAISSDPPIQGNPGNSDSIAAESQPGTLMFPHIIGILAFDTPYLGISPGVIAHGAETHYRTASSAYSALSEVAGVFGYGSTQASTPPEKQDSQKLLTQGAEAMTASMANSSHNTTATPTWQRWGKYAMFAGAASAVAAGGTAALWKKDKITEGWSWIGSHLEFVGCLARGEELKSRLERIAGLNQTRKIGFANIVTILGKGATPQTKGVASSMSGGSAEAGALGVPERTFCTIPKSEKNRRFFLKMQDNRAKDETTAHMQMFEREKNSGYFALGETAKELVVKWVEADGRSGWYRESEPLRSERSAIGLLDMDPDENKTSKLKQRPGNGKAAVDGDTLESRFEGAHVARQPVFDNNPWKTE